VIPSNAENVNFKDGREAWKKYKYRRIRRKKKLRKQEVKEVSLPQSNKGCLDIIPLARSFLEVNKNILREDHVRPSVHLWPSISS
jgi:hypothetical protein